MKIIKEKVVLTKFELEDVYEEEYTIYLNSISELAHTVRTDNTKHFLKKDTYNIAFDTGDFIYRTVRIDVSEEDWCKIKELMEENTHLNMTENKCSDSVTYRFYGE